MKQLAIIGACGHGKVLADIAIKSGYERIVFLDDNKTSLEYGGFPIIGKSSEAEKYDCDVAVAIGNAKIRQRMLEELECVGVRTPTLIHPDAVIASDVIIGNGTVVMAGVVLSPGVVIGKGCIINTCSSVDHDCHIHGYVHVAVGAHLAGEVEVGTGTWIGAGVTISNNVYVCSECIIGAGAVVIKDIHDMGTYLGVPARKLIDKRN